MKKRLMAVLAVCVVMPVSAGWQDMLEKQLNDINSGSAKLPGMTKSTTVSGLSQQDMITGLKQALDKGVGYAVDSLGQSGGFLDNKSVKIPMPQQLAKVEGLLRKTGQGQYADQFIESMNRAAEQAVPMSGGILKKAVQQLTIDDAKNIINGPDDAATRYLQKIGGSDIRKAIEPIVKDSTDKAGVTREYKSLFSNLGMMGGFINTADYDVDKYVTDKTMDGLFTMIAEQEKKIRENPVERSTELLKQIFSN